MNYYNDWNLPVMQAVESPDKTEVRSFTYDNLGRKTSATNDSGTATYEYDDFGRMVKETDVTGAVKEYTYDENGNRTSFMLTIDGTQQMNATYSYDRLNQLTGVTIGGDTTEYEYDKNGNIISSSGAMVKEYTYNQGNMLTGMDVTGGSFDFYTYSASFYLDGNKKQSTDDHDYSFWYEYDGRGQLKHEAHSVYDFYYTYDAYGNRIQRNYGSGIDGSETVQYMYDANNKLLKEIHTGSAWNENLEEKRTTVSYAYDANGNQTYALTEKASAVSGTESISLGLLGENDPADGTVKMYTYDGFGQRTGALVDGKAATYAYNPDGLRVSKTVNGETTTHILDGSNVVVDLKSGSVNKYYRGVELIKIDQNGTDGYYLSNAHGDIIQIINDDAVKGFQNSFDAFGVKMRNYDATNEYDNPFGYAGEYTDAETEQVYLRARYYDPARGRFTSEDPLRDGDNWYAYGANNPVLYADPSGYKITLSGTDEEKERIMDLLRQLTDDKLEYIDGEVKIVKSVETDRKVGQELIKTLIWFDEEVNISFGVDSKNSPNAYEKKTSSAPKSIFLDDYIEDSTKNPNGYSVTDLIDAEGNVLTEQPYEGFLVLGHELIHAYHDFYGNYEEGGAWIAENNEYADYLRPEEELRTVGIDYSINGKMVYTRESQKGLMTENGLRLENQRPIRPTYKSKIVGRKGAKN